METFDHLFVTCLIIASLWTWIANYNNFHFNCDCVSDLWLLDALIPLKNSILIELIRAATIWVVWLTKNRVCFNGAIVPSLSSLGSQIITLTSYWYKSNSHDSFFKLTLALPIDVTNLSQADNIITNIMKEESNTWNSEEEQCHGLEGSYLSEYLRDHGEMDASLLPLLPYFDPTTITTGSSYDSNSAASWLYLFVWFSFVMFVIACSNLYVSRLSYLLLEYWFRYSLVASQLVGSFIH